MSEPDLLKGIPSASLADDAMVVGRVGEAQILLVRTDEGVKAVQATCPHYGAPLIEGCLRDGRIHCPWHHAAFALGDGALCRPPALAPLESWPVEEREGVVRVLSTTPNAPTPGIPPHSPGVVAVIGAGAAGTTAVLTLRDAGYSGRIVLIDPDAAAPYDRPNLSKDYLAGTAPEEWLPLRSADDWTALDVRRVVDGVARIRPEEPVLDLVGGDSVEFDELIVATGASPRRLPVSGADHAMVLRSLDDCRAIRERAEEGARAVVVGAGFIGMEVAAALRARDVEVDVVAPEAVPLGRILGEDLGADLRALHERHGVRFHLETGVREIAADRVHLDNGDSLPADLIVIGVGAEPRLQLAIDGGLAVEGGVVVDSYLESSRKGVYAVGDIAAFPDPLTGQPLRIEHWAVAEAQGRIAALNVLGHRRPFRQVPFFWTTQFGVTLQWSGFPGSWDRIAREGSFTDGDLAVRYLRDGRPFAGAFVGRDREGLRFEFARADEVAAADA